VPPQLIIGLLVIAALAIFLNAFLKASPAHVAKKIKQIGFYVAIGLVVLIAVVKLNWIIALIGALFAALPKLLPLLRYLPILKWIRNWKQSQSGFSNHQQPSSQTTNNSSEVSARYITMTLNHDNNELDGEVIEGYFVGQRLSAMSMQAIIQLYEECLTNDEESAALVKSYLDRIYGEDWYQATHHQTAPNADGKMSYAEALEILGLDDSANEKDIVLAHRRLMQKIHPDRGGSDYLAAKINQAKKVLLNKPKY